MHVGFKMEHVLEHSNPSCRLLANIFRIIELNNSIYDEQWVHGYEQYQASLVHTKPTVFLSLSMWLMVEKHNVPCILMSRWSPPLHKVYVDYIGCFLLYAFYGGEEVTCFSNLGTLPQTPNGCGDAQYVHSFVFPLWHERNLNKASLD